MEKKEGAREQTVDFACILVFDDQDRGSNSRWQDEQSRDCSWEVSKKSLMSKQTVHVSESWILLG